MMVRILSLLMFALLALSSLVFALAPANPQPATTAAQEAALVPTSPPGTDWPLPQEPFDETPITPVESAGAPMFP